MWFARSIGCDDREPRDAAYPVSLGIAHILPKLVSQGYYASETAAHHSAMGGIGHLITAWECYEVAKKTMPQVLGNLRLNNTEPVRLFGFARATAHDIAYHVCETVVGGVVEGALGQIGPQPFLVHATLRGVLENRGTYPAREAFHIECEAENADRLILAIMRQTECVHTIVAGDPHLWPALATEMRSRLSDSLYTRERQALLGGGHEELLAHMERETFLFWDAAEAAAAPRVQCVKSDRSILLDGKQIATALNEKEFAFFSAVVTAAPDCVSFPAMQKAHPILERKNQSRLVDGLRRKYRQLSRILVTEPNQGYKLSLPEAPAK
jgi:hypothetical protein